MTHAEALKRLLLPCHSPDPTPGSTTGRPWRPSLHTEHTAVSMECAVLSTHSHCGLHRACHVFTWNMLSVCTEHAWLEQPFSHSCRRPGSYAPGLCWDADTEEGQVWQPAPARTLPPQVPHTQGCSGVRADPHTARPCVWVEGRDAVPGCSPHTPHRGPTAMEIEPLWRKTSQAGSLGKGTLIPAGL